MAARRVVVDGSNIATEGRTVPSLRQLNEAVLAFLNEYPDTEVTVVVDATFGHRIDPAETREFEEAESNNELVSPPAGAIGRGDAFLLRIAGKIGATVLSNDSFQEFHGEHDWLFEEGRLIGGKPVPGIGWIFTPRTPVRGVKSRKAVKEAKRGRGAGPVPSTSGEQLGPMPSPKAPPPRRREDGGKRKGAEAARVEDAIAAATAESVAGDGGGGRKRRRKKRGARPAEPVNEALPFITFIAEHPLGSEVDGEVETFTSHGAFVLAGGARCYVPISALGDPPPRAARDVLNRGESRRFVIQALDPQRRGIELALPEFAKVSGAPLPETIEAEISEAPTDHRHEPAPAEPPPATVVEEAAPRPRKAAAAAKRAPSRTAPAEAAAAPSDRRKAASRAASAPEAREGGPPAPEAGPAEASVRRARKAAASGAAPLGVGAGETPPTRARRRAPQTAPPEAAAGPAPEPAAAATGEPGAAAAPKAPKAVKPVKATKPAKSVKPKKAAKAAEVPALAEAAEPGPAKAPEPTPPKARPTRKAAVAEAPAADGEGTARAGKAAKAVKTTKAAAKTKAAAAKPAKTPKAAKAPAKKPAKSAGKADPNGGEQG